MSSVVGVLVLVVGFGHQWVYGIVRSLTKAAQSQAGSTAESCLDSSKGAWVPSLNSLAIATGWVHGISGIGLLLNLAWATRISWLSGVLLVVSGVVLTSQASVRARMRRSFLSRMLIWLQPLLHGGIGVLAIYLSLIA